MDLWSSVMSLLKEADEIPRRPINPPNQRIDVFFPFKGFSFLSFSCLCVQLYGYYYYYYYMPCTYSCTVYGRYPWVCWYSPCEASIDLYTKGRNEMTAQLLRSKNGVLSVDWRKGFIFITKRKKQWNAAQSPMCWHLERFPLRSHAARMA